MLKKNVFKLPLLFIAIGVLLSFLPGCEVSEPEISLEQNDGPVLGFEEFLKERNFVLNGDEYIYEGDVAFSPEVVQSLYDEYCASPRGNIANDSGFFYDTRWVWSNTEKRNITYRFTSNMQLGTFSDAQVRAAFREAAAAWNSAGVDVEFREVTSGEVFKVFTYNKIDGNAAMSFFPHGTYAYELKANINSTSFTSLARITGIFTHELGHSLGLAHEHQRADAPNHYDQGVYGEAFGAYDPNSVMEYRNRPYLGGISDGDIALVRYLYGTIHGNSEADDLYGKAVASGDFDNDGFEDAAIGIKGENSYAGAVNVIYGSSDNETRNQFWYQDSTGIIGTSEPGDYFGSAVAVGDFDNDGFDDLAVGAYGEAIGSISDAGHVNVIYGSAQGLTADGNQVWYQDSSGILDYCESGDYYGYALAAGDFDNDGFDDLAVGARGEDVNGFSNAGAVNVIFGSSSGLTATGDEFWHQDFSGISSSCETDDYFGSALAAGDFDNDGFDDLAVGVEGESIGAASQAGAVSVIYGASSGLTPSGNQFWRQGASGIIGSYETLDHFGYSLAVGDFDRDGYDDLAIGVPHEDIGSTTNAGSVNVIFGSLSGLTATGNQAWNQNSTNIEDSCEAYDSYGYSLAAGDFDGDGYDDLAVGIPDENIGSIADAGAVSIIFGASSGLTSSGDQFWHQDSSGIEGGCEANDEFGHSVAALDLNNDGFDDLAIGVVCEAIGSVNKAGAVNFIRGSSGGLTSSGDIGWNQNF